MAPHPVNVETVNVALTLKNTVVVADKLSLVKGILLPVGFAPGTTPAAAFAVEL